MLNNGELTEEILSEARKLHQSGKSIEAINIINLCFAAPKPPKYPTDRQLKIQFELLDLKLEILSSLYIGPTLERLASPVFKKLEGIVRDIGPLKDEDGNEFRFRYLLRKSDVIKAGWNRLRYPEASENLNKVLEEFNNPLMKLKALSTLLVVHSDLHFGVYRKSFLNDELMLVKNLSYIDEVGPENAIITLEATARAIGYNRKYLKEREVLNPIDLIEQTKEFKSNNLHVNLRIPRARIHLARYGVIPIEPDKFEVELVSLRNQALKIKARKVAEETTKELKELIRRKKSNFYVD